MGLRELPCGGASNTTARGTANGAIGVSASNDVNDRHATTIEEDTVPMPDGGEVKVGGKTRMGHVLCGKCVGKWLKLVSSGATRSFRGVFLA